MGFGGNRAQPILQCCEDPEESRRGTGTLSWERALSIDKVSFIEGTFRASGALEGWDGKGSAGNKSDGRPFRGDRFQFDTRGDSIAWRNWDGSAFGVARFGNIP